MTPPKRPGVPLPLSDGGKAKPPNYDRVVKSLSDRELHDEKALGRGEPGYQDAVASEMRRRGI